MLLAAVVISGCSYIHDDNYKTLEEVRPVFADKTMLFYTPGVGLQVEYFSPDGKAYYWHHKNDVILRGEWKVESRQLGNGVCFRYEPFKYNPVTGRDGSKFTCILVSMLHRQELDTVEGDVLGLRHRHRVPFPMPPGTDSIEELRRSLPEAE